MKQFSLLPAAAKELQKALLKRMLFLGFAVLMAVVIVPMIISGVYVIGLAGGLTLIMMAGIMIGVYLSSLTRQTDMLTSFRLTISDESITREIKNVPNIVIACKDIQKITRNADGSFLIKGNSLLNAIGVPASIERVEEVESLLMAIKPFDVKSHKSIWHRFQYVFMLAFLGVMFGAFLIDNKYVSTALGIVFVGVMVYSFVVLQRSKNVERRAKLLSYGTLIPTIAVIARIASQWMAA